MRQQRGFFALVFLLALAPPAFAQQEARLSVFVDPDSSLVVAIQPDFHVKYGCAYPMTYRVQVPDSAIGLVAQRRHSSSAPWDTLPEKTSADLFNGIEAVRFDYPGCRAHISASFAGDTDSLFLRLVDSTGAPVSLVFQQIDTYYDDRRAAVTVSADDWCDNEDEGFRRTLDVFRSYGLYVTGGVISGPGWCSGHTWHNIQSEVDAGYLEVASHSRTHTGTPYADAPGEVQGGGDDILSHLRLPATFSSNHREYVYVWIAPYGSYDAEVDSLVGARGYLVPRLYNHTGQWGLSYWDPFRVHFGTIQATVEIGAPPWGGGSRDSIFLNGEFDSAVFSGNVYHLMWHPQGIANDLEQPYVASHLAHISGHPELWYANLGHVYLYHLIELANRTVSTTLAVPRDGGSSLRLRQNYPNPFSPRTTIGFDVAQRAFVSVRILDVLGRRIATLVNGTEEPGRHFVTWDARKAESGTYFCQVVAGPLAGNGGAVTLTRKMLRVK